MGEWEFPQLVTALEKWTQRNPISNNEIKKGIGHHGKEKLLNTKRHQKKCVYCEYTDHNSTYCKKVESIAERKKMPMEKSYASTAPANNIDHQIVQAKEHVQLATKDVTLQYVANLTQVFPRCLQQIKEM